MKLLHVVPSYLPAWRYGGPVYSVHGLCKGLASLGHDVQVFTTNLDGPSNSDVPLRTPVELDGVTVTYFGTGPGRRLFYSPDMRKALARCVSNFDVVHLHSVFLWPTWAAARAAARAGVPYVLSPRGMLDARLIRRKSRFVKALWIRLIERRNLEHACLVHVTSELEKSAMSDLGFNPVSVACIGNGIDPPPAVDEPQCSGDIRHIIEAGDYVLYLGRVHWKKGLDRLVDAWPENAGCRLVIAGNDEEAYAPGLQRRISRKGAAEIELLARSVVGGDKEALLSNARLFVLPSYSENFGNTVLEAMVRGIPVLVTEEVGAAEVVSESGGGRVVEGSALGGALREMLHDPEQIHEMGRRGQDYALQQCSWRAVAGRMEAAYGSCLNSVNGVDGS